MLNLLQFKLVLASSVFIYFQIMAGSSSFCFENWFVEKEKLISQISQSTLDKCSISRAIKNFKDALDKYPNTPEVRAEKAKYGLGPPEYLYSEDNKDPRDVKTALWTCVFRGHCHKERQTKILLQVTEKEHFEALEKVNFIRPGNCEAPIFLCAYHFTVKNETTGNQVSAVFLRHWFVHQTIPEGVVLCLTVRKQNKKTRHSIFSQEKLWGLLKEGVLLHDDAVCKMKGANAL